MVCDKGIVTKECKLILLASMPLQPHMLIKGLEVYIHTVTCTCMYIYTNVRTCTCNFIVGKCIYMYVGVHISTC